MLNSHAERYICAPPHPTLNRICLLLLTVETDVDLQPGAELGGATAPPKFCLAPQWPPKNFSGLFLKVLHRPLTAPLVAKLAPPVAPQMKMSGSAPAYSYCKQMCSDLTCNEQVKTSVCHINFDGSSANVTLFSSRRNSSASESFCLVAGNLHFNKGLQLCFMEDFDTD